MIIDVHAHYLPESAVRAHELDQSWHGTSICRDERGILVAETAGKRFVFGSPTHFEPLANRIERMDARGVDTELLSLLPPLFRYGLPAADGIAAAKDVNDELSDLAARFPGRILGLATLPLQDPEASIAELERAMNLPGITGVTIGTHVNGTDLDAEELAPVFRAMHDLDAFLFIHPMDQRAAGVLSKYYLRNIIGNPLETTIAAAALMLSGRLDELPRLQVCLAHGGGYVVPAVGRMQHGYGVREETPSGAGTPPRDQFRRFLYDTLTHDEAGLRHLIDQVGADHVVLGTDFPADMGQTDAALEIQASGLFTEEEKSAILGDNLARILGLTAESGRIEKAGTHG
jgi:aminocarboxymuconate-semialdehyde decarboxylase